MVLSTIKDYKMKTESIYLYVLCLRMVSLYLISTIFAPYQKSIGIPLEKMAILEALFWVIMLVMEIPTGIIADKRGRAWSIKTGSILFAIGIFSYGLAFDFWSALVAETFIATGMAFNSGADDAWITDALARENKETLKSVKANTAKWVSLIAVIAGTSGAYIAKYLGYRSVWFVGGLAVTASYAIAMWQMKDRGEVIIDQHEKGSDNNDVCFWNTATDSIKVWKASWPLKWISIVCIVFSLGFCFNHYWTIYFSGDLGMKDHLGIAWAIFFPAIMIGPWMLDNYYKKQAKQKDESGNIKSKHTEVYLILVTLLLTGSGLVGAGYSHSLKLSLLFCMIHEIGRGLIRPLQQPYIHERIKSKYRATYDSIQNMVSSASSGIVYMSFYLILRGKPATAPSVSHLWIIAGSALVVATLILWLIRPRRG